MSLGAMTAMTVIACTGMGLDKDPRSWIQNPGPTILDPGSKILGTRSRILDPGSRILDPGPWIQDPGSWAQDPGFWSWTGTKVQKYENDSQWRAKARSSADPGRHAAAAMGQRCLGQHGSLQSIRSIVRSANRVDRFDRFDKLCAVFPHFRPKYVTNVTSSTSRSILCESFSLIRRILSGQT